MFTRFIIVDQPQNTLISLLHVINAHDSLFHVMISKRLSLSARLQLFPPICHLLMTLTIDEPSASLSLSAISMTIRNTSLLVDTNFELIELVGQLSCDLGSFPSVLLPDRSTTPMLVYDHHFRCSQSSSLMCRQSKKWISQNRWIAKLFMSGRTTSHAMEMNAVNGFLPLTYVQTLEI
jgi:hypothetical protein